MGLTRIRATQISDSDYKQAARVITEANINLSGGAPVVVDGVTLSVNNRVLVNGQTDSAQNGLYRVQTLGSGSNGTWTRTVDADQNGEIRAGMIVMVTEGAIYADTPWKLVTNGVIVIGTTELSFEQFGGAAVDLSAVAQDILPAANVTYDLGSETHRWNDLWLSNTTIYIGDAEISASGANLLLPATVHIGNAVLTELNGGLTLPENMSAVEMNVTGNVTANNFIGGNATVSGITNLGNIGNVVITGGINGYVITTDGAGNLRWAVGGGGGISWTTQANTPPQIAAPGDFWYDSEGQVKYQYTNDGNSNVWVDQSFPTTFSSISTGQILNAGSNGIGNIGSELGAFENVFSLAVSVEEINKSGSNGVGNIGAAGSTFNTVFAKATAAQYADLAELYSSDQSHPPGTVVIFGGSHEVTQSYRSHDHRIAGVVSTDPAFIMNSAADGIAIALTGRVPCWVQGPVEPGDLLTSSDVPGVAQRMTTWTPGCVIGKSLVSIIEHEIKIIEVVVGRF